MLKKFGLMTPDQVSPDTILLRRFDNPVFKGNEIFFFKQCDHIIIYSQEWFTPKSTGVAELLADQIEIPAPAIQWIVDTIEIKFFKPPAQGGLPAASFHHCETIEGEELCINRSFGLGEGVGGYRLVNLNRHSHMLGTVIQEFSMPDPFLFQHGLMDYLKELGAKISKSEV